MRTSVADYVFWICITNALVNICFCFFLRVSAQDPTWIFKIFEVISLMSGIILIVLAVRATCQEEGGKIGNEEALTTGIIAGISIFLSLVWLNSF